LLFLLPVVLTPVVITIAVGAIHAIAAIGSRPSTTISITFPLLATRGVLLLLLSLLLVTLLRLTHLFLALLLGTLYALLGLRPTLFAFL
jgi:hypothetical protein